MTTRKPTVKTANRFLSCDWGTSWLRLRLVEGADLTVVATAESAEGIAPVFARWRELDGKRADRPRFYRTVLQQMISALERSHGVRLAGVPIVVSGMASSSIGMVNVPYKSIPFAVDGSDLRTRLLHASPDFGHDILMISGVRDRADVMRGEEVQLVGALGILGPVTENRLLIFPGTHSKHVVVNATRALAIRTYSSVEPKGTLASRPFRRAFAEAVRLGAKQNLLNALFSVRVRAVLERVRKPENFHYLSGLLLGGELRDLAVRDPAPLVVVAPSDAAARYHIAMSTLRVRRQIVEVDVERSLIAGQARIARRSGVFGSPTCG